MPNLKPFHPMSRLEELKAKKLQEKIKKASEFMWENCQKEGVLTTHTGLQYLELQEGNGQSPSLSSTVTVHYEGKLINGDVFDSSFRRGKPSTFPLKNVIAGWQEGLQLMSIGAKYRLFINPNLAYGEAGSGLIGPHEVLIFEVELLSFEN